MVLILGNNFLDNYFNLNQFFNISIFVPFQSAYMDLSVLFK